ncbi:dTMP kinase [Asanoa sp. WMMD1127]|uniref:dTMP kinase n=1 Tax=Asanoa sp. WMMD1127 TaxID=3016107 RepID=UPI002416C238|nr:dTMP kinase [Asanoa sp. WMMD1127]MDG4820390.1 dTMP kinase [Asanoa sp. WMMD1127]
MAGDGRPVAGARLRTVALVGIDGSGKTTQANRLAMVLGDAGVPAVYRQNAGGRAWFGHLARRLGRADGPALFGRVGMLWVESVLRWLAIARTTLRSAFARDIAVMDRHAVDQYVSIRAHAGGRGEWLARLAYALFPAPDVTVLLAVDPRDAYRRIEARGTDHESLAYLSAADAAFRSLPESPRFLVVDAGGAPDEVTTAVLAALRPWLPPVHLPPDLDPDGPVTPARRPESPPRSSAPTRRSPGT